MRLLDQYGANSFPIKTLNAFLLGSFLLVLAACATTTTQQGGKNQSATFGMLELAIREPAKVEAFRVRRSEKGVPAATYAVGGSKVIYGPTLASPELTAQLQQLLRQDEPEETTACSLAPILGLRFHHKQYILDAVFCFNCNEVAYFRNGKEVHRDTTVIRRASLVKITKELFPRDGIIRKLQETPPTLAEQAGAIQ